jgi:hypothetical protein
MLLHASKSFTALRRCLMVKKKKVSVLKIMVKFCKHNLSERKVSKHSLKGKSFVAKFPHLNVAEVILVSPLNGIFVSTFLCGAPLKT